MFQIVFFVSWGALVGRRGGEDYGDHCAPTPPNFNVGRRGVLALAALAGVPLCALVIPRVKRLYVASTLKLGGAGGSGAPQRTIEPSHA